MNPWAYLILLATLVAVGPVLITRALAGKPEPAETEADLVDVAEAFFAEMQASLTVPCMETQPTGLPLICGRDVGHAGHHIAFGTGHRLMATWPQVGPRLRVVPEQWDGSAS